MSLKIEDLGGKRLVTVDGEQMDEALLCRRAVSIETPLATETVEDLCKITGEMWLVYAIRRIDSPDKIFDHISAIIDAFPPDHATPRFLDFGCGWGASAVALARKGYEVVGVDVDANLLRLARAVCRDYGVGDLATFVDTDKTVDMPLNDGEFDAVLASGVFEHIKPRERSMFARECWRLVKPGGNLYILGTPNRLWPVDNHSTGLALVHWLPLWLARPLIRRLCRGVEKTYTAEQLVDGGLIGLNLFNLLRSLPGSKLCVREGGNVPFYFSAIHSRKRRGVKRLAAGAVTGWFRLWEKPLRSMKMPIEAFFPYINVAIKKSSHIERPG